MASVGTAFRRSDSYGIVLALLLLSFILSAMPPSTHWLHLIRLLLLGGTMLFALRTSRVHGRILRAAMLLFVVAMSLGLAIAITGHGSNTERGVIAVLDVILLALVPPVVVNRILRHPRVDVETIVGAVSVYIILGVFFQSLYIAVDAFETKPFFVNGVHTTSAFQFFSFVTLTTVGYGNLIPKTSLGQSLAVLEALLGQIYLVTLVARLVSLFGRERDPGAASPHASSAQAPRPSEVAQVTESPDLPNR